jgi:hypothetical protein
MKDIPMSFLFVKTDVNRRFNKKTTGRIDLRFSKHFRIEYFIIKPILSIFKVMIFTQKNRF